MYVGVLTSARSDRYFFRACARGARRAQATPVDRDRPFLRAHARAIFVFSDSSFFAVLMLGSGVAVLLIGASRVFYEGT